VKRPVSSEICWSPRSLPIEIRTHATCVLQTWEAY